MTQQEAMNNIMQNWVRTKRNLAVVKQQMASGSITQHSMEFDINQTEQILKSHGFVYRIVTKQEDQEPTEIFFFRAKQIRNMRKVLKNYTTKHNVTEYESIRMDLMVG